MRLFSEFESLDLLSESETRCGEIDLLSKNTAVQHLSCSAGTRIIRNTPKFSCIIDMTSGIGR